MTKEAWGTKRSCPKCSARFYDLGKMPVHCPKCSFEFDPAQMLKPRRGRKKTSDDAASKIVDIKKTEVKRKPSKTVDGINIDEFSAPGDIEVDTIEEIEEIDDIDNLEEIAEIDDIEEDGPSSEDDADDEAILEEMEPGDKTLIDTIEDDEESEEKD